MSQWQGIEISAAATLEQTDPKTRCRSGCGCIAFTRYGAPEMCACGHHRDHHGPKPITDKELLDAFFAALGDVRDSYDEITGKEYDWSWVMPLGKWQDFTGDFDKAMAILDRYFGNE